MRARTARSAAAAGLLTAISVAGCASSDDNAASEPETTTVTVEVTQTAESTPQPPDTATPTSPETTQRTTTHGGSVSAGGRCEVGEDSTVGLVVKGTMTCGDLRGVWKKAVADPAFAHHGNHNRIMVGDWTCRAHQTRPVQTGFCAKDSYRVKFKVIHR